jgi:hypothetical protein
MLLFEILIAISELVATYLIWHLWKSDEILFFKISYSIIAFIPFFGPIFVVWMANMPSSQPRIFQDQHYRQSDVFDRWRHVLSEKNPHTKFRLWQAMIGKKTDDGSKP